MRRRAQNKMAESLLTLPVTAVLAALLWWLPAGGYSLSYLCGLLVCAWVTYVLVELNVTNALLRIRSRMVSSLWLMLMAACGFLHPLATGGVVVLCVSLALYALFRTYDHHRPTTDTFHAYLLLSLGSLAWPPLLLLIPVALWGQGFYLRSLRAGCWGAALIGLIVPYWFWAITAFVMGDMSSFIAQAEAIIAPLRAPVESAVAGHPLLADTYLRLLGMESEASQWAEAMASTTNTWEATVAAFQVIGPDEAQELFVAWAMNRLPQLAALALVNVMGFTGYVHYRRKSFDDKIRVRMLFYTVLTLQVVTGLWLLLQPGLFHVLFPLQVLLVSLPAAHFMALTHTWTTNAWTFVLLTLTVGVAAVSLVWPYFQPDRFLVPIEPIDVEAVSSLCSSLISVP